MKTIECIIICTISAYTSVCFAQIVSNGDFEIPQVTNGTAFYFQTNNTSATWTWTAPAPTVAGVGGIISPPGIVPWESDASFQAPAAPSGNQIAFVQLAYTNYATMSETVTLPASGIYSISYYDAGRPYWALGEGGNTTYNILLDTNVIATVSTTTGQPFKSELFTFSSTAGQHTLAFNLFAEPTYDNTAFFDDIEVNYVGPLVSVDVYAGLTITGAVGSTNQIQFVSSLSNTNWVTLTNLVLSQSPYLFFDSSTSARSGSRFYRAVLLP
jgi:hypothetical protein